MQRLRTIMTVFALVGVLCAPASFAQQREQPMTTGPSTGVAATVQAVNASAEIIMLKTEKGESVELRAPTAMLTGLQAGDIVEVKMVGTRATEIRKKDKKE